MHVQCIRVARRGKNDEAVSETWNAFFVCHFLRSHEHQTVLVTTVNRIVRRHEYRKTLAVFRTFRLTAVISAFHVFHLHIFTRPQIQHSDSRQQIEKTNTRASLIRECFVLSRKPQDVAWHTQGLVWTLLE